MVSVPTSAHVTLSVRDPQYLMRSSRKLSRRLAAIQNQRAMKKRKKIICNGRSNALPVVLYASFLFPRRCTTCFWNCFLITKSANSNPLLKYRLCNRSAMLIQRFESEPQMFWSIVATQKLHKYDILLNCSPLGKWITTSPKIKIRRHWNLQGHVLLCPSLLYCTSEALSSVHRFNACICKRLFGLFEIYKLTTDLAGINTNSNPLSPFICFLQLRTLEQPPWAIIFI